MGVYTDFVGSDGPYSGTMYDGGIRDVSDYTREIELYDFDNVTKLLTLSGGANSSLKNVRSCQFTLERAGGCGVGSLTLSAEFFQSVPIQIGQYVHCSYKPGEKWYVGRVESITHRSPIGVEIALIGQWALCSEIAVGGRSWDANDIPAHLVAYSNWFENDPDYSIGQTWDTASTYVEVIQILYDRYVAPKFPFITLGPINEPDPERMFDFSSFKFRGDENLAQILQKIALIIKDASYGIDERGEFFFRNLRESTGAVFKEGRDVRNLVVEERRDLIFSRILLTGDYVYGSSSPSGFYRYHAMLVEPTLQRRYGDKHQSITIPFIRCHSDAYNVARSMFNKWGKPSKRCTFTTAAQSLLLKPWTTRVKVLDKSGATVFHDTISSLTVHFDAFPFFDVVAGRETLEFPSTPELSKWEERSGDLGDAEQPNRNVPSYVNSLSGSWRLSSNAISDTEPSSFDSGSGGSSSYDSSGADSDDQSNGGSYGGSGGSDNESSAAQSSAAESSDAGSSEDSGSGGSSDESSGDSSGDSDDSSNASSSSDGEDSEASSSSSGEDNSDESSSSSDGPPSESMSSSDSLTINSESTTADTGIGGEAVYAEACGGLVSKHLPAKVLGNLYRETAESDSVPNSPNCVPVGTLFSFDWVEGNDPGGHKHPNDTGYWVGNFGINAYLVSLPNDTFGAVWFIYEMDPISGAPNNGAHLGRVDCSPLNLMCTDTSSSGYPKCTYSYQINEYGNFIS